MSATAVKTLQPLFMRARATAQVASNPMLGAPIQSSDAGLLKIAQHMFSLMLRNVASEGFEFADPYNPQTFSAPGCVIASPSYRSNPAGIDQDYVYNWTRDAAITAMEIAAANMAVTPQSGALSLIEYVTFA